MRLAPAARQDLAQASHLPLSRQTKRSDTAIAGLVREHLGGEQHGARVTIEIDMPMWAQHWVIVIDTGPLDTNGWPLLTANRNSLHAALRLAMVYGGRLIVDRSRAQQTVILQCELR